MREREGHLNVATVTTLETFLHAAGGRQKPLKKISPPWKLGNNFSCLLIVKRWKVYVNRATEKKCNYYSVNSRKYQNVSFTPFWITVAFNILSGSYCNVNKRKWGYKQDNGIYEYQINAASECWWETMNWMTMKEY